MIATGTALALGLGAAGTATSLYGANKNAKAAKSAQNANLEESRRVDAENMKRWMMTRGIGPNGQAVNTRLPQWATLSFTPGGRIAPAPGAGVARGPRRTLIRRGS